MSLANNQSAIEIRTRSAEIGIMVDRERDAEPGLAADLMAKAQRYIVKARAEAEVESKSNPEWFKSDDRRWTYELVYSLRSLVAGRFVSVIRSDGTDAGGAHPNSRTDTILWDRTAMKRISVRSFYSETADNGPTMTALAALVRRAMPAQKIGRWKEADPKDDRLKAMTPEAFARTDQVIVRGIQPKLLKLGPISLAPSTASGRSSGLTFHFSPYDVDAYAAGLYTVFVPWTEFRRHLSPEGIAIFGGERPDADKEP